LVEVRASKIFAIVLLFVAVAHGAGKQWGDYYPHTRWVAKENESIQVDALKDRLVISAPGKSPVVVGGNWYGRNFWRTSENISQIGYFLIAHWAVRARFSRGPLLQYHFVRVRPDPN